MNFKVSNYGKTEKGRQLTVRQAKGRQPRVPPVSPSCAEAIDDWLKVRNWIAGSWGVENARPDPVLTSG